MQPLMEEDSDDANADSTMANYDRFNLIQQLDKQLQAHMTEKEYALAFEDAMEMCSCSPKSYYGYLRTAEIHLVQKEYDSMIQAYYQGVDNVEHTNENDKLRRWVEATQYILQQEILNLAEANAFDEAHRVGNWLIRVLPTSPTGYLCLGKLYKMQGLKEKATDVYKQGITAVTTMHKCVLQQEVDWLLGSYDFIHITPLRISTGILQCLNTADIITCTKVSTKWRKYILQCPEAWRLLTLDDRMSHGELALLQKSKWFVRRIKLSCINSSIVDNLLSPIANGEFENLVDLEISSEATYGVSRYTCVLEQANITTLCLCYRDDDPMFTDDTDEIMPFHQVLENFPRLKRLDYRTYGFELGIDYERLSNISKTAITHLMIGAFPGENHNIRDTHISISRLLPIFPHLVYLCVPGTCHLDYLLRQNITKHCPNLRWLKIGLTRHDKCKTFSGYSYQESESTGLHYFEISMTSVDQSSLASVISKNSSTLESLLIESVWLTKSKDQKHIPPTINSPVLKSFNLLLDDYHDLQDILVFGDCPSLESISLQCIKYMEASIFPLLKRLPNLRVLELYDCRSSTSAELLQLFDDLAKQEDKSQLRSLTLCETYMINDDVLYSLAKLQYLQSLHISGNGLITESGFKKYTARIRDTGSNLQFLELQDLSNVTDHILVGLITTLPRLQQLTLTEMKNITEHGIRRVVEASAATRLSALHIEHCSNVHPMSTKDLNSQIDVFSCK